MDHLTILLSIAIVHLLVLASPGPTMAVIVTYATQGHRRAGFLVTLGVLLATLAWASCAALGLGTIFTRFPAAYRALQLAGAAYLIYLGVKMLVGWWRAKPGAAAPRQADQRISDAAAIRAGFITNITNPKVVAYYASLFGVMIPSDAPRWLFAAAAGTALAISALWWSSVTLFCAAPPVARAYERMKTSMDGVMGAVLIVLGLRMALSG